MMLPITYATIIGTLQIDLFGKLVAHALVLMVGVVVFGAGVLLVKGYVEEVRSVGKER